MMLTSATLYRRCPDCDIRDGLRDARGGDSSSSRLSKRTWPVAELNVGRRFIDDPCLEEFDGVGEGVRGAGEPGAPAVGLDAALLSDTPWAVTTMPLVGATAGVGAAALSLASGGGSAGGGVEANPREPSSELSASGTGDPAFASPAAAAALSAL